MITTRVEKHGIGGRVRTTQGYQDGVEMVVNLDLGTYRTKIISKEP